MDGSGRAPHSMAGSRYSTTRVGSSNTGESRDTVLREFDFVRSNGDAYGGIAFAPDGSFFVLEAGNLRVQKFDRNRHFVKSWGEFGSGPGNYNDPVSIGVGPDGNVYVLDDVRGVVEKYDTDGNVLGQIAVFSNTSPGFNKANAFAIDRRATCTSARSIQTRWPSSIRRAHSSASSATGDRANSWSSPADWRSTTPADCSSTRDLSDTADTASRCSTATGHISVAGAPSAPVLARSHVPDRTPPRWGGRRLRWPSGLERCRHPADPRDSPLLPPLAP